MTPRKNLHCSYSADSCNGNCGEMEVIYRMWYGWVGEKILRVLRER